ncbi:hypothetical protein BMI76_01345 [Streptococcus sp. 'caviae']|nr:hypothetical protein BMI76_01345 [Streptococcus sp. 'caviae']
MLSVYAFELRKLWLLPACSKRQNQSNGLDGCLIVSMLVSSAVGQLLKMTIYIRISLDVWIFFKRNCLALPRFLEEVSVLC